MVNQQKIAFGDAELYYTIYKGGPKVMITFHGFGQTGQDFEDINFVLSRDYTVYNFDLFFHGKSTWMKGELPILKQEWKHIFDSFLSKNNITNFSIMGYSMGGKFALATSEAFPSQTERLILLAPDGVKKTFWYNIATYPSPIRAYFKSFILKPKRFYGLLNTLKSLKIVDRSVIRFTESQMNTTEKRQKVYLTWVVFKKLSVNIPKIVRTMNDNDIDCFLFMGKYDKVIASKHLQPLSSRIPKQNLFILETGHNELIKKSAKTIAQLLSE